MKILKKTASAVLIVAAAVVMASCGKKAAPGSAATGAGKGDKAGAKSEMKIAYVEVDSIMTQYDFAIKYGDVLKKKMQTIQTTLQNRGAKLQRDMQSYQAKAQAGKMTQAEMQAAQNKLQKDNMQLQNLQESLSKQYQDLQEKYNKELHDSIQSFLESYNKDMGYDYILSKSGDNILYANKKLNITEDVVKGLNKRYKDSKK